MFHTQNCAQKKNIIKKPQKTNYPPYIFRAGNWNHTYFFIWPYLEFRCNYCTILANRQTKNYHYTIMGRQKDKKKWNTIFEPLSHVKFHCLHCLLYSTWYLGQLYEINSESNVRVFEGLPTGRLCTPKSPLTLNSPTILPISLNLGSAFGKCTEFTCMM